MAIPHCADFGVATAYGVLPGQEGRVKLIPTHPVGSVEHFLNLFNRYTFEMMILGFLAFVVWVISVSHLWDEIATWSILEQDGHAVPDLMLVR